MTATLCVAGLHKKFGDTPALHDLSLSVAPGEIVGLVGPDGAGKTTTMRIVAGLLEPDAGDVTALGQCLARELRAVRRQIGYMPQHYSLYGDLSVQENLRFFAGMYGVRRPVLLEREQRLLAIARLDEFRSRPAVALSGGMYKKLALCCALVHQPRLLLLDEPTNGVDPISRRELWYFLAELIADGVAVLITTPYMDEAERCHRVGLLVDGRLVALDAPAALQKAFKGTVFEVATAEPLGSAGLFVGQDGVDEAYMVGRKMHVVTRAGPDFGDRIATRLRACGVAPRSIDIVPPSFEDIFMSLSTGASTERVQP
jgi:ABC-2 type transport system ATP-binding protein